MEIVAEREKGHKAKTTAIAAAAAAALHDGTNGTNGTNERANDRTKTDYSTHIQMLEYR